MTSEHGSSLSGNCKSFTYKTSKMRKTRKTFKMCVTIEMSRTSKMS